MMYHHYFRSTAPARPQKRFWYSVAFIWFARLWVSLYENLCRLFFIIFFYRNSYIIRCDVIPFLFNIPFSSLCTTKENTPNHLCCCCTSISVEYDFWINNQGCNLYASTFSSFACFFLSSFSFTSVWVCVWRSIALCLHFKFLFLSRTASLSHY